MHFQSNFPLTYIHQFSLDLFPLKSWHKTIDHQFRKYTQKTKQNHSRETIGLDKSIFTEKESNFITMFHPYRERRKFHWLIFNNNQVINILWNFNYFSFCLIYLSSKTSVNTNPEGQISINETYDIYGTTRQNMTKGSWTTIV